MPVWKPALIPVFENFFSTWKSIKTRNVWGLATMWFKSNWPCFIKSASLHKIHFFSFRFILSLLESTRRKNHWFLWNFVTASDFKMPIKSWFDFELSAVNSQTSVLYMIIPYFVKSNEIQIVHVEKNYACKIFGIGNS